MKTNEENSKEALEQVLPVLEGLSAWTYDAIHDALIGLAQSLELKNGRIMWPVRTAVSGKAVTPGGAVELCHILGREESLRRIRQGIAQLGG
jgi:glutamyl-tRNA synthetase